MIKESKKNRLPADLYSRNTLFGLLVNYILGQNPHKQTLEILDVGGYGSKLAWFLPPQAKLTVLDLRPAPENGKTAYVQANAKNIPFPDANFDLVISSDMLEHVSASDRGQVVREIFRVSGRHVILAAPFSSIITQKAEEYINEQFKKYTGRNHPFLQEHLENGLPELDEVEAYLAASQYSYLKIGEGNIYNWYLQQLTSTAQLSNFNEFFNLNLAKLGNFRAPTYRTVLFCDKQDTLNRRAIFELVEDQNNFHTTTYLESYKIAFDDFKLQLDQQKNLHQDFSQAQSDQLTALQNNFETSQKKLANRENQIKLLDSQINEINNVINDKNLDIRNLQTQLTQTESNLVSLQNQAFLLEQKTKLLDTQLRSQDLLLGRLKHELESSQRSEQELTNLVLLKEQSINEKTIELNQKNQQISNLQISLAEYRHELETVLNSRSWQLVKVYGKFKHIFYSRPKYLLITSWQVFSKMGPAEFFRRVKRKLSKKFLKSPVITPATDYLRYVEEQKLGHGQIRQIHQEISSFDYKPLISIIMPVYNVEEVWLRKAINSVIDQYYDKWELCIADDASTHPRIRDILKEYSQLDQRIRVVFRPQNGGIVKASNTALKMAKGAYVGLLDNDDEISPDALYEVVRALQTERYDLLYSDEDKLELDGTRCDPHFKPDFSPDLLFSNNYICHFSVIRRKILEEIGGFREGLDGSQDYDLILRITEKKRSIHHIRKVLYHWRKIPGSTAATIDAKSYVFEAAKKALRDTLKKRGLKAEVLDGMWKGSYRVKRAIKGEPLVSIIIPFRDKVEVLKVAIDSIFAKTSYENYEILLVNNDSQMLETRQYIREMENCPRVEVLHYNAPFNFSAINNFAALKAKGDYLILLNNDTEVIEPDWIQAMLEHAERPEVGCVGAKLLYPNNQIQHAGVIFGVAGAANHTFCKLPADQHGYMGNINVIRNYSAVTAACLMIKKSVYEEMDGLDEENLAVTFNDMDFCLRLRERGYLIVYTPYASLYHHESYSRGHNVNFNEEYYLRTRHQEFFKQTDPYYNPHLTRERLDFSLRVCDQNR